MRIETLTTKTIVATEKEFIEIHKMLNLAGANNMYKLTKDQLTELAYKRYIDTKLLPMLTSADKVYLIREALYT